MKQIKLLSSIQAIDSIDFNNIAAIRDRNYQSTYILIYMLSLIHI